MFRPRSTRALAKPCASRRQAGRRAGPRSGGERSGRAAALLAAMLMACGGGGGGGGTASPPPAGLCSPSTGLAAPLPACTPRSPCTRLAPELGPQPPITDPTDAPFCVGGWSQHLTQSVLGFTRHACVYRPPGASSTFRRPLVLWFHPGGAGSADAVAAETGLLDRAQSYDLSGDLARLGFVLVSVQGRNLRFPTAFPRDGRHHDFYYRDLRSPSANPDIANADSLIDTLVQEGIVDPARIYVTGWSNGAFFAMLYAIARHDQPTPGGNRVAAASVFAGGDPFAGITWDPFNAVPAGAEDACRLAYPASSVPMQLLYRTADAAVPCESTQALCFQAEPGYNVTDWLADAAGAGLDVRGRLIEGLETNPGDLDRNAATCTVYTGSCPVGDCDTNPTSAACLALQNHFRWPDGIYDEAPLTGLDREPDMLDFLRAHPR